MHMTHDKARQHSVRATGWVLTPFSWPLSQATTASVSQMAPRAQLTWQARQMLPSLQMLPLLLPPLPPLGLRSPVSGLAHLAGRYLFVMSACDGMLCELLPPSSETNAVAILTPWLSLKFNSRVGENCSAAAYV